MSKITIRYIAHGWHNGVRWQSPASLLTHVVDAQRWYGLDNKERDRVLERATLMQYPEVDRIDEIIIMEIR